MVISFVVGHGYKFIVTDLLSELSEDKKLKRVSTSHLEGRGSDIVTWETDRKSVV